MGLVYQVTCRKCGYQITIYEGPGAIDYARDIFLEEKILNGDVEVPEDILRLLRSGYHLQSWTTYLCPVCKKWVIKRDIYIRELIQVSPYGTIREYKMHYLHGVPRCEDCNTELINILNHRSSKAKCPKCGSDYKKISQIGRTD